MFLWPFSGPTLTGYYPTSVEDLRAGCSTPRGKFYSHKNRVEGENLLAILLLMPSRTQLYGYLSGLQLHIAVGGSSFHPSRSGWKFINLNEILNLPYIFFWFICLSFFRGEGKNTCGQGRHQKLWWVGGVNILTWTSFQIITFYIRGTGWLGENRREGSVWC